MEQAVLDWTVQQQASGDLSTFDDLQVMGCSAGALGGMVWIEKVLTELDYIQVGVVPDSYLGMHLFIIIAHHVLSSQHSSINILGVFPDGVEGPLIYDYGLCTTPLPDSTLYESCVDQTLTFEDIVMTAVPKFPTTPFAYIQESDAILITFSV